MRKINNNLDQNPNPTQVESIFTKRKQSIQKDLRDLEKPKNIEIPKDIEKPKESET